MPKIEEMTLEQKVDELLKYQRRLHHIAIARMIFTFLTFFILVVLPIIGFYYVAQHLKANLGLSISEIGDTLKQVKDLTDLNTMDGIRNFLQ